MLTEFFALLASQPLDIRISAGLTIFSVGILAIASYPLVIEAWELATRKS